MSETSGMDQPGISSDEGVGEEQVSPSARAVVDVLYPIIEREFASVRMEVEQLRQEVFDTVQVLQGNDNALVGELQKIKGSTVAELLQEAGESWARFVKGEAENLGMRVVVAKGVKE